LLIDCLIGVVVVIVVVRCCVTVSVLAAELELSPLLVSIRHAATHDDLPLLVSAPNIHAALP